MKRCLLEINIPQTPVPGFLKPPSTKKPRQKPRPSKPQLTLPSGNYDPDFFMKYRSLIQKNYAKSTLKDYQFPRDACSSPSGGSSSRHSSIDSMRGVLAYRLNNQNKKPNATQVVETQRIFANGREGVRRMFQTTPKNRKSMLKNRSLSPVCFQGLESDRFLEARKTADKRIFFVYCTKFKQREAGFGKLTQLTHRRLKTAHPGSTGTR